MEDLTFDSILEGNEIEDLFADPEETITQQQEEQDPDKKDPEEKETITEDIDSDTLFQDPSLESVGNEEKKEENKEKEEPESDKDNGTSPNNDSIYSSIAEALTEEGIFPDLDDDIIKKVKTAEDFRDLIESQIKAGLDERQKRINDALDNGVEPSQIKGYEGTLNYLSSITEKAIEDESETGEALRRRLIYQDFLNRNYTQEKAKKLTERAIQDGTDVADAKEALESNKEFFKAQYDSLLAEAKAQSERETAERKKESEALKDSILKDKQLFGDVDIDVNTRKKMYDNVTKPIYRDKDTGEYYTALQKYQAEHKADFLKYTSLFFTLTDGYTNFDNLVKGKVRKEVKRGLKELEHTLRNSRRDGNGNLNLVTSENRDSASFIGKGIKLDF